MISPFSQTSGSRLNGITSVGENAAFIKLMFDGGFAITYVVAASSAYSPGNSSSDTYYFVNGFNQTGTWRNIVRNVQADLEARFSHHSWNLTEVEVYAATGGGGSVSVIFDDMNFVRDTHAPTVTQVQRNPTSPMYYSTVQVSASASDNLAGVESVYVYYHQGTGPWSKLNATLSGGLYRASIPTESYGVSVYYYVNATDNCGNIAVSSTDSYVPGDDIAPVVDSISANNNTVVTGWNYVNVSAHDPGVGSSGVSRVELWFGSTLLANGSSGPYQLHWNSGLLANGNHTLTLRVVDNAGNTASTSLRYDIENPVSILTLVLGAGIVIAVVVALAFVCMKGRHK